MSSENTECFFEIDAGDGWEKSLTTILSSFEDPVFDINPTLGYAYVKGKTDRHQILKKLKKGGKHSELKRITFGSDKKDNNSNNNNNNNNLQNHYPAAYASLSNPYYNNYANDPYNYHSYANYNHPWHHNNNPNHLFLFHNARNYYHGPNHRLPRGSFHRHDSSLPSSSTSSTMSLSSSSRPVVTEPEPTLARRPQVKEPLRRSAPSRRLNGRFIVKKVISIKKVITRKFRSCLRFCDKIK